MKLKTKNRKQYYKDYYILHKKEMDESVKKWRERNPNLWKIINKRANKRWLTNPINENRHRESDKEYQRKKRELGLIDKSLETKLWNLKHPNGKKAHYIVYKLIKKGKLKRGKCELRDKFCSKIIQAHHENYDKPLEINWLCASHHKKVDLGLIKINKQ